MSDVIQTKFVVEERVMQTVAEVEALPGSVFLDIKGDELSLARQIADGLYRAADLSERIEFVNDDEEDATLRYIQVNPKSADEEVG